MQPLARYKRYISDTNTKIKQKRVNIRLDFLSALHVHRCFIRDKHSGLTSFSLVVWAVASAAQIVASLFDDLKENLDV